MLELPLIARARLHGDRCALRFPEIDVTYRELVDASSRLASMLLGDREDLSEGRVAFLLPAGADYVAVQWAIWRAGGVAVPLCLSAAEPELEYTLDDSQSQCLVTSRNLAVRVENLCQRVGLRLVIIEDVQPDSAKRLPDVDSHRRAMMLYTSGTTNKPKGVVTTHSNIESQITTLIESWEWRETDSIPLFLPLHHIHGIINVMCCALWSGAVIEPFAHFEMDSILNRVAGGAYSVFMAVPTIYVKLLSELESRSDDDRARAVAGFAGMRLMVSGSAALPARVHEQWSALTGQALLERYGMTEIGMALSNPYHGQRRPGTVGQPLPGVHIRLITETGNLVTDEDEPGEIQVRGPAVFREYWNRPEITADSFDDGWFRTGDVAKLENGYYRIMGRMSVDIIKSGGYKLSALEIEATILDHPAINECAVVGVDDDTWGEAVALAAVLRSGETLSLDSLRSWCREQLSAYKIPKRLVVVDRLPRNAMGKVTKPDVRALF